MATVKETTVMNAIRADVKANGLRPTARRIGVSASMLSDVLRGSRSISDTIAGFYGFEREVVRTTRVTYRRKQEAQVA